MKYFFKKIGAIGASALLTGMTMGVAAAANYPMPFVSGGAADVAVVYGAAALPTDAVQAGNIQTDLQARMGGGSSSGGGSTATGGDSVKLEKANDKFNLMNNMSNFYTKLDDDELSSVLAPGTYSNDQNDDYEYTQFINIGSGMQLKHFLDSSFNDDKPIIGFDLSSGQHLFNYTLSFTDYPEGGAPDSTNAAWRYITNTYLPMLGQTYYVLSMTNTSSINHKITLLNSAADGELSEGETTTLVTDSATYEVSVAYIDTDSVKLTISGPNGAETTKDLTATATQKLSDGSYVGIKEVSFQGVTGGASFVSFSIGSGKLVLENTKEVELNGEKLSATKYEVVGSDETVDYKVNSYIETSGSELKKVVLEWKLDDDSWIAPGTDMILPGFETVKFSMAGFTMPGEELTTLTGDSNRFTLKTTNPDGDLDLKVLYLNSSSTGIEGIGRDSTHKLVTSNGTGTTSTPIQITLNETENSYFVVSWVSGDDYESYAYELGDVVATSKNRTTLKNLVSDGKDITISEEFDSEVAGNVKFLLDFAREEYPGNSYVRLNISASSSGSVYLDRLITNEGLQIRLPVHNLYAAGDGNINLTAVPTSWTMNFTEEDKDGNIALGKSFTVAMAPSSSDGIEPATIGGSLSSTTMYETEDNSKVYLGYMPSDLATKLVHDKPSSGLNDLEITYHGGEAYGEVYVAETGVVISTTPGTTTPGTLGNVIAKDNEVSSVSTNNLIIVGGTCINTAAASALGVSPGTCGAAFTTATGVGSGEFLIKGVADAFSTGKLALVVAGYDAQDTVNAATFLTTQPVDTSKEYKGTSGTSATMVVA